MEVEVPRLADMLAQDYHTGRAEHLWSAALVNVSTGIKAASYYAGCLQA